MAINKRVSKSERGLSQRMGADKATVPFAGERLWARQLRLLRELKPDVLRISARARPAWCRDLYGLPRKFNAAFEGGGSVDTVADTNDLGFMAITIANSDAQGDSLKDGSPVPIESGVYFRVELAGITGHKQLATDAGILIRPSEVVAVAGAMIRVFVENGDRTDRKKARLKYLIDKRGPVAMSSLL